MNQVITIQFSADEFKQYIKDAIAEALPQPPPKLYPTSEAAKFLGITTVTLHTWKQSGKVKALRVGNNLRFEQTELDRLIQEVPRLKNRL